VTAMLDELLRVEKALRSPRAGAALTVPRARTAWMNHHVLASTHSARYLRLISHLASSAAELSSSSSMVLVIKLRAAGTESATTVAVTPPGASARTRSASPGL